MSLLAGLRIVWKTAWRSPGRTFLMMLGTVLGLCSLTVLNSIGEGTRQETMKRVKNMLGAFDTVIIRPGAGEMRGMVSVTNSPPNLRFEDAAAIASQIAQVKQVALLQNAFDVDIKYRGHESSAAIFGVSANWLDLRGDAVAQGDFFSQDHERAASRVAVLGPDAEKELFPAGDAVGKSIVIGDAPFQVIGLLAPRGAGPSGASLDNLILIPVTTASKRLFNRDFLTMVIAQVRDPQQSGAAVAAITALLRSRHRLAASAIDDFTVTDPQAVMKKLTGVGSTLTRTLSGIAIGTIILGGIVITTLMSIGVAERQHEIGIRRSVGASRSDILVQFLLESACITAAGGLVGIGIGSTLIRVVSLLERLPFVFLSRDLVLSVLLSIVVGLIFGLYPALRGARTDPIQALRM